MRERGVNFFGELKRRWLFEIGIGIGNVEEDYFYVEVVMVIKMKRLILSFLY